MSPFLKKGELLSGKKEIENLFNQGRSFSIHPFRIIYEIQRKPCSNGTMVLFSVPKKRFSKAVHRNSLKRKMREAYRLNKNLLTDAISSSDVHLSLAFVYTGNELKEFSEIEHKIILSLNRLVKEYEKLGT